MAFSCNNAKNIREKKGTINLNNALYKKTQSHGKYALAGSSNKKSEAITMPLLKDIYSMYISQMT